jgi:ArsR family transcriptional regulator
MLRIGEMTVSELRERLAIEASSVSQQLGVLRARQLVVGRKEGTSVYYRVVDPNVFELLDIARALFERQLGAWQAMADESDAELLDEVPDNLAASVADRPR